MKKEDLSKLETKKLFDVYAAEEFHPEFADVIREIARRTGGNVTVRADDALCRAQWDNIAGINKKFAK